MAIKLIASDVDGTLLSHDQCIHSDTRNALLRAGDAGLLTTLATGRSFSKAWELYSDLGMNAPLITINGAIVRDQVMVYRNHLVALEVLQPAIDFARDEKVFCVFFHNDELYAPYTAKECQAFIEAIGLSDEDGSFKSFQALDELYDHCECKVNKILFWKATNLEDHSHPLDAARKRLKRYLNEGMFPPFVELTSSYYDNIELMPRGVNKGTGLAELCEAFQIMPDEVMCFGDNENDIGMFEFAGHSVAMGNASDFVKKHARYVTDTVEKGGVGQMIERVLNGDIT